MVPGKHARSFMSAVGSEKCLALRVPSRVDLAELEEEFYAVGFSYVGFDYH